MTDFDGTTKTVTLLIRVRIYQCDEGGHSFETGHEIDDSAQICSDGREGGQGDQGPPCNLKQGSTWSQKKGGIWGLGFRGIWSQIGGI